MHYFKNFSKDHATEMSNSATCKFIHLKTNLWSPPLSNPVCAPAGIHDRYLEYFHHI